MLIRVLQLYRLIRVFIDNLSHTEVLRDHVLGHHRLQRFRIVDRRQLILMIYIDRICLCIIQRCILCHFRVVKRPCKSLRQRPRASFGQRNIIHQRIGSVRRICERTSVFLSQGSARTERIGGSISLIYLRSVSYCSQLLLIINADGTVLIQVRICRSFCLRLILFHGTLRLLFLNRRAAARILCRAGCILSIALLIRRDRVICILLRRRILRTVFCLIRTADICTCPVKIQDLRALLHRRVLCRRGDRPGCKRSHDNRRTQHDRQKFFPGLYAFHSFSPPLSKFIPS